MFSKKLLRLQNTPQFVHIKEARYNGGGAGVGSNHRDGVQTAVAAKQKHSGAVV